ncbi:MAG TPA: hypothetical protein DCY88_31290 [Cyanobacteria bacterium UBA11372]|nr:hypothetical protein [Cyanobacteria bacterium UBA11372]
MTTPSNIKVLKPTKSISKFAAKALRSLPLRTVLIVPFVAQIVGAVGLVGYLSFRNGQKAVEDLAQQLMGEASKRVEDKLTNFLGNAELVNQLTADAIERGELSLNLEQPQPKGEKYFWQQMQAFKSLRWISFSGEATGGFIAITRHEKNNKLELVNVNSSTNHQNVYYDINKNGVRGRKLKIVPGLYEPRTSFWYKKTVAANQLIWLDIYQGFDKGSVYLSALQPIRDRQGKLLGVSSADFTLAEFQKFLNQIKLSENGQILAIDQSGLLVASTSRESPFQEVPGKKKAQRLSILDSKTPIIRSTAQYLSKSFQGFDKIEQRQQLQFTENGQRYFVQVVPFTGKNGLKWSIAIAVPESDFMAQINANNRTTILLCLAALTIATILGIFTSRWITRPILKLQQASEAIATGELDRTIEIDGINELNRLARAFNEMAAQLKTSFTELEDRVAERTVELQQAKELADNANQAKSTFLANMSHELRSPLNAVLGFAQIMMRSRSLPSEHIDNVGIISRSGEHLLTLINQVLEISKIEAGRTTLNEKNFDLYRLLDDVEDMFRLKADDAGLQLLCDRTAEVPRYIRTDQVKLRQILINLLNNAIKFTAEGGVSVRVGTSSGFLGSREVTEEDRQEILESKQQIYFEVEDSGAGIAPEELDKLFEAFMQTSSGKNAQEGTGLGLAISRQFVKLMGGDISVSSQVGVGTIFKFNITAQLVDASDDEGQKNKRRVIALEPNQPRYRILIVDDKPLNRQLLVQLLNPFGFELKEACNGREAVEIWNEWEPHLIWMDMRMPVMDGYSATQEIKATTKGQATAVIALTASVLEEEKAIVLSAGCDDFMRKPFREDEIFTAMNKHIGVRYIYEEPSDKAAQSLAKTEIKDVLAPEAITKIPSELLLELASAANRSDMVEVDNLIQQVKAIDRAIADAFSVLANEFEFGKIASLIEAAIG